MCSPSRHRPLCRAGKSLRQRERNGIGRKIASCTVFPLLSSFACSRGMCRAKGGTSAETLGLGIFRSHGVQDICSGDHVAFSFSSIYAITSSFQYMPLWQKDISSVLYADSMQLHIHEASVSVALPTYRARTSSDQLCYLSITHPFVIILPYTTTLFYAKMSVVHTLLLRSFVVW